MQVDSFRKAVNVLLKLGPEGVMSSCLPLLSHLWTLTVTNKGRIREGNGTGIHSHPLYYELPDQPTCSIIGNGREVSIACGLRNEKSPSSEETRVTNYPTHAHCFFDTIVFSKLNIFQCHSSAALICLKNNCINYLLNTYYNNIISFNVKIVNFVAIFTKLF